MALFSIISRSEHLYLVSAAWRWFFEQVPRWLFTSSLVKHAPLKLISLRFFIHCVSAGAKSSLVFCAAEWVIFARRARVTADVIFSLFSIKKCERARWFCALGGILHVSPFPLLCAPNWDLNWQKPGILDEYCFSSTLCVWCRPDTPLFPALMIFWSGLKCN